MNGSSDQLRGRATSTAWAVCVGFGIALATLSCVDEPDPTPLSDPREATDGGVPTPSLPETKRVSEAEVESILRALAGDQLELARDAVKTIVESGDRRFASVLIELMRASQVQILHADGRTAYSRALEAITGQLLGDNWGAWVEWYDSTELSPPPGFTGWKGELLGRLDPAFADFLPNSVATTIRVEEIVWGGVAFDGIPALDQPKFTSAQAARYLEPDEPVFGISVGDDARAYPLRILDWHEMTNDVVGGVPVSLAYCTLCGAGIAYDGRAADGRVFTFGSSGLLMRSNKLMFDRETRSLWNQFTGRPIVGLLAEQDFRLNRIPLVIAKWSDWKAEHPQTRVLDIETGHDRTYTPGAAYAGYFSTPDLMFPVRARNEVLAPKTRIYGVEIGGAAKAYRLATLAEAQVTNDRIAMTNVVLVANRGLIVVDGRSLRTGPARYEAGGEVRAFERGDREFSPGSEAGTLLDADGAAWRISEDALVGPDGQRGPRLAGHVAYWFAWNAFHPQTQLYRAR